MKLPDTFKIEVTQDHINNGKRNNWKTCPIALSVLDTLDLPRQWGEANRFSIYGGAANIEGVAYVHDGAQFIATFDQTGTAEPTTITFTRP